MNPGLTTHRGMPARQPIFRPNWDKRTEALRRQQNALALAADRITQPGLSMDKPDAGVTPAAGIANLEAEVQDAQSQLDELSDLARQHNIEPGVLRG
jgi:hypothetical protein